MHNGCSRTYSSKMFVPLYRTLVHCRNHCAVIDVPNLQDTSSTHGPLSFSLTVPNVNNPYNKTKTVRTLAYLYSVLRLTRTHGHKALACSVQLVRTVYIAYARPGKNYFAFNATATTTATSTAILAHRVIPQTRTRYYYCSRPRSDRSSPVFSLHIVRVHFTQ